METKAKFQGNTCLNICIYHWKDPFLEKRNHRILQVGEVKNDQSITGSHLVPPMETSKSKAQNRKLSIEVRREACVMAQTQALNTKIKLLQYKWMMLGFARPFKLNKHNDNIADIC